MGVVPGVFCVFLSLGTAEQGVVLSFKVFCGLRLCKDRGLK